KGNELSRSFTTNLLPALHGKLAGLTVEQYGTESGEWSANLYSRGISTLNYNNLLVIVDGFESDMEHLVSDEIETISLLKDASAVALYGSRGANGVLLVSTKRGTNEPLKISFSTMQGFQSPTQLPDFLGSYDYALLYNEALDNDGKEPLYSPVDLEAYKTGDDPYFHPDVNWYDEVLRKNAPIQNYNLNFSGGSENVRYFVLFNLINSGGLYKKTSDSENSINTKYRRYNFRSNVDIDLLTSLKAIVDIAGSVEDKDNPFSINSNSIFTSMSLIAPNAFPVFNPDGSWGGNNLYSNPLGDITETGFHSSNARTLQATFKLIQDFDFIAKGISLSGAVSFNNYFRTFSSKTRQYERFAISKNSSDEIRYNKIGQNTSLEGSEGGSNQWRRIDFQSFLDYNRTFNKNVVNAMLMFSTNNYKVGNATGLTSFPYRHNNFGGRFTLANNEKYIGEFSFGISGSENFPKNNRYGFFPAASLGWIVSKEDFFGRIKWVDYLKVRGSYGLVGNDNIGGTRFMYNSTYSNSGGYFLGNSNTYYSGVEESTLSNPRLTWEKALILNVGLEARIVDHIDISIDVFKENRNDVLSQPYASIPGYLGITLPALNIGEITNKGVEAMLRYHSNEENKFQYIIEGNIWYAKNELKYFSETPKLYDWMYQTGHRVFQPFGYESIGLFKDESDVKNSPVQTFSQNVQPGDIKYRDMNNDGVIDQLDMHAIGNTGLPELTYSLHTFFKYKGFDLNFFFQGVEGRTVWLTGYQYEAFQNDGKVASIALGRWTKTTAGTATYPRLSSENNQNNFGVFSSYWQRNGSFLKLRTAELGYTLPKTLLERIRIYNARVFVNGNNLFTLDHLDYSDPEIMSGYPPLRTLSIGCKIWF
ncbi:MAG: SusC/RagA family TonB-linked outer membrane protein, partial [Draconibacterium sp.]